MNNMETPKYEIDQRVWFIEGNKINNDTIAAIEVRITRHDTSIKYILDHNIVKMEEDVYKSKQDLIATL